MAQIKDTIPTAEHSAALTHVHELMDYYEKRKGTHDFMELINDEIYLALFSLQSLIFSSVRQSELK
jgi:hypothetical protein